MGGENRGKQFEQKFREDWLRTFPNSFILRLQDSQSGYYGTSSNPCDFITFEDKKLFLIECKSVHGNTLPFSNISQYDKLLKYKNIPSLFAGVLVWWIDLDKIAWVPIKSIEQMKKDNKKSVHINMLKDKLYNIIEVPSIKKRIFMDSNYKVLLNMGED